MKRSSDRRLIGGPIHVPTPDDPPAGKSSLMRWGFVAAILVPIVGVVIAIVLLVRNQVGPGLAVLLTCFLGFALALALVAA